MIFFVNFLEDDQGCLRGQSRGFSDLYLQAKRSCVNRSGPFDEALFSEGSRRIGRSDYTSGYYQVEIPLLNRDITREIRQA